MATIQKDRILQLRGEDLCDRDGDKIGSVEEIYLDADTGAPEWALVKTGRFGGKGTFVPLRDAGEADGTLRVPFDKATVKDAPTMEPDGSSPGAKRPSCTATTAWSTRRRARPRAARTADPPATPMPRTPRAATCRAPRPTRR